MKNQLAWLLNFIYNSAQLISWGFVLTLILTQEDLKAPSTWDIGHYWHEDQQFRKWLDIAQYMQFFDIVLSITGLSKSSVATVFVQILSRLLVLHCIFPHVEVGHYGIFMATICWAGTEVFRYSYYTLKQLGLADMNPLVVTAGVARYNGFLGYYPIGVSGELVCFYKCWQTLSAMNKEDRFFSTFMPNSYNFTFDFCMFIQWVIPALYIGIFPKLFGHMLRQRRKYLDSLCVPVTYDADTRFTEFMPIHDLNYFLPQGSQNLLSMQKMKKGRTLEHQKGSVMIINFWATWSQASQKYMALNQAMLEQFGKKWVDKDVRIIGIGVDKESTTLADHVNKNKWTSIEMYQNTDKEQLSKYGIKALPEIILIDQQGQIVFKGHPEWRKNLPDDINRLANAQKLQ